MGGRKEGLYLKGRSMNECKGEQEQGIKKISGKKMQGGWQGKKEEIGDTINKYTNLTCQQGEFKVV